MADADNTPAKKKKDLTLVDVVNHMSHGFGSMDKRFSKIDERFDKMDKTIKAIKEEITEFREENKREHEAIREDLESIGEDIHEQKHEINPRVGDACLDLVQQVVVYCKGNGSQKHATNHRAYP